MAPELDMTPAGLLLNAYHRGGDVEAVLDQVDCRGRGGQRRGAGRLLALALPARRQLRS